MKKVSLLMLLLSVGATAAIVYYAMSPKTAGTFDIVFSVDGGYAMHLSKDGSLMIGAFDAPMDADHGARHSMALDTDPLTVVRGPYSPGSTYSINLDNYFVNIASYGGDNSPSGVKLPPSELPDDPCDAPGPANHRKHFPDIFDLSAKAGVPNNQIVLTPDRYMTQFTILDGLVEGTWLGSCWEYHRGADPTPAPSVSRAAFVHGLGGTQITTTIKDRSVTLNLRYKGDSSRDQVLELMPVKGNSSIGIRLRGPESTPSPIQTGMPNPDFARFYSLLKNPVSDHDALIPYKIKQYPPPPGKVVIRSPGEDCPPGWFIER